MSDGLFERIRSSAKAVTERAQFVHIERDRIADYAASLPADQLVRPKLDPRVHYLGHAEATAVSILVLDSINFGSGYFPHLTKRPGHSGYFTIAAGLKDYFDSRGTVTALELSRISRTEVARILGQDLKNQPVVEFVELMTSGMRQLGWFLINNYAGSFSDMLGAASGSAETMVRILERMIFFRDVQRYGDLEVPFYKRAQLTVADLSLAFDGESFGRFDGLDDLTIFADNLVPHVLRIDGILRYDQNLERRIEAAELIPCGSREEVEIRASAVHACELIREALTARGTKARSIDIDYLLWNRGQQPEYKAHPRHRTRTVFY
jgi:hypothetical protein